LPDDPGCCGSNAGSDAPAIDVLTTCSSMTVEPSGMLSSVRMLMSLNVSSSFVCQYKTISLQLTSYCRLFTGLKLYQSYYNNYIIYIAMSYCCSTFIATLDFTLLCRVTSPICTPSIASHVTAQNVAQSDVKVGAFLVDTLVSIQCMIIQQVVKFQAHDICTQPT
jgi:hypothetical protein